MVTMITTVEPPRLQLRANASRTMVASILIRHSNSNITVAAANRRKPTTIPKVDIPAVIQLLSTVVAGVSSSTTKLHQSKEDTRPTTKGARVAPGRDKRSP